MYLYSCDRVTTRALTFRMRPGILTSAVLAVAFCVCYCLPPGIPVSTLPETLFGYNVPLPASFHAHDLVDLLSVLVHCFRLTALLKLRSGADAAVRIGVSEVILLALWFEGHGMHLASNSIHRQFPGGEGLVPSLDYDVHLLDGKDVGDSVHESVRGLFAVEELTYLYDEVLGHSLWFFAEFALTWLVFSRLTRVPESPACSKWSTIETAVLAMSSAIYGLVLFLICIEGQGVLLGLAFAIGIISTFTSGNADKTRMHPLVYVLLWGCIVYCILLGAWVHVHEGNCPQLSELGFFNWMERELKSAA